MPTVVQPLDTCNLQQPRVRNDLLTVWSVHGSHHVCIADQPSCAVEPPKPNRRLKKPDSDSNDSRASSEGLCKRKLDLGNNAGESQCYSVAGIQ